jgi:hypothetical protein
MRRYYARYYEWRYKRQRVPIVSGGDTSGRRLHLSASIACVEKLRLTALGISLHGIFLL